METLLGGLYGVDEGREFLGLDRKNLCGGCGRGKWGVKWGVRGVHGETQLNCKWGRLDRGGGMRSINVVTDGIQAQVGVLYGTVGSIMKASQLFNLVGIRDGKSDFVERGTAVVYIVASLIVCPPVQQLVVILTASE